MAYIYRFGGNKKARSAYCKTRKFYIGGLEGNRTLDLCVANAALSQLSYKPMEICLADTKWMLSSNIQFYAANQSSLYSSIILQYSFSSQSI